MKRICEEVCPNCDAEVAVMWDPEKDGYKTFCPNCGGRLMLCNECLDYGNSEDECNYNSETDTCKHNAIGCLSSRLTQRKPFRSLVRGCFDGTKRKERDENCYGCEDRTKCNYAVFEKLAEYEDIGYSPDELKGLLKKTLAALVEKERRGSD